MPGERAEPLARRGLQGTDRKRSFSEDSLVLKLRRSQTAYKAEGCEVSWQMTAKPTGTKPTVNAALMGKGPQPLRRTDSSLICRREICTEGGARW